MIYLDYAATTPLDPEVRAAMEGVLEEYGNPSSIHQLGRRARSLLEEGRERLARALGAKPREVVLTAGGSEADALALYGVALARGRGHLVSTAVEHSAVLQALKNLERLGFEVTLLQPDRHGLIYPEQVAEALRPATILVSVMAVNNELGTLYPVREIAEVCHARGVLLHTDAVQAMGTVPCQVETLGADLISLAAHKFYGPKGVGALYVRKGVELFPIIPGKQEQGYRGGTENLPAVYGQGLAAEKAAARLAEESRRLLALRERLEAGLLAVPGVLLNGHPTLRSPKHVNVTVRGADGEGLLLNLDLLGVAVSSGSACSSGSLEPSHVLLAIGRSKEEARASVRFSLGRYTTEAEVDQAVQAFAEAVERSRVYT
ncbi:cysteine desulfurase family protein [Meiothermus ruber]|jgi:cysteine desulfurase|uniref:Cysteine desulfurase n=1 Tax=Meiothermus ruber (strain ATCC 35948 / DSM 1279 / VKM B-1258 / 21) TaxID=504728 RepID=D3PSC2_MEIRD|nr:cysteine desulfurase family protein [Meiothermus ruber]GIW39092.1 MAG: cysteine desulfurase [Meiothermus sp.]ADD28355.1 Cysteine desulfurase [Meiothermus ruber DSM 1279]AGK06205.1 cysteine desulfurase [Meiothermus ruber DSM 1279]MCL6529041.1 cysteine desulfurase [Meiothermus ruber]GAO75310.1 cysteine desulfurase [Meiothermus ruber H328]